jgi:3-oxoadipate enol-lactonase
MTANSLPIAHYRHGDPDGFPLILSSSLGTTAAMWDPQLELLGRKAAIVTYDHRGHGGSYTPDGPYTLDDLGGDVVQLMDSLSITTADFAGLSLGGMVGMWLAENSPNRVRRLALLCTYADVATPKMWIERATTVRDKGTESMLDGSLERWFTPGFRRSHPETVAEFGDMLRSVPDEGYASCCEAIGTMAIDAGLDRIESPTLVIAGTRDQGATPEMVSALAGTIPRARYAEVDGAHLASVERASEVTSLLLDHFS